ncbi:MAG: hypothetical protein ACI4MG_04675 [Aristaeellaceae bacterium]
MKRIKAACIMQTLVFSQKEAEGFTPAQVLQLNRDELAHYKAGLNKTGTRHQITGVDEQPDGSIIVRVRKQYNGKADVEEYFI